MLGFGERSARDDFDALPLDQSSWQHACFQLSMPHCLRYVYPRLYRSDESVSRESLFSLIFAGEPVTRFGTNHGYLRQGTYFVDQELCCGSKQDRVVHKSLCFKMLWSFQTNRWMLQLGKWLPSTLCRRRFQHKQYCSDVDCLVSLDVDRRPPFTSLGLVNFCASTS